MLGRKLVALLALTMLAAMPLGGCCEEDGAEGGGAAGAGQATAQDAGAPSAPASPTLAEVDQADASDRAPVEPGQQGAREGEGYVEIELTENSDGTTTQVVVDRKLADGEVPKQEPTDVLYELKAEQIPERLKAQGWEVKGEGKEIPNGFEYMAASGDKQVKIEIHTWKDNEAADKQMFKTEKTPEVAFGRVDEKTLTITPVGDGTERRDGRAVLRVLMTPPGEKVEHPVDPSDNPPEEPEELAPAVTPVEAPKDGEAPVENPVEEEPTEEEPAEEEPTE